MLDVNNRMLYGVTAREGMQCPSGCRFSHEFLIDLAQRQCEIGVYRQELGSPAAHPVIAQSISEVADSLSGIERWVHVRCNNGDIKYVPENVDGVGLYFGTSPAHQQHNHRKRIEDIINYARDAIDTLEEMGYQVRFTAEDATRTQYDTLLRIYQELEQSTDVNLFGVADTVGTAMPNEIFSVIAHLKSELETPLQFHGHNDRGFADINGLYSLIAGAESVQVSAGGIGERNGITSISGLLINLLEGDMTKINNLFRIEDVEQLELFVLNELEIPRNYRSPIASHVSVDMAGVHQNGSGNNIGVYHAIDLTQFGYRHTSPVNHPLTGHHNVARVCEEQEIPVDHNDLRGLTNAIKEYTFRQTRDDPVRSEEDVVSFIRELASTQ